MEGISACDRCKELATGRPCLVPCSRFDTVHSISQVNQALPLALLYFLGFCAAAGLSWRISRHSSPASRELLGLSLAVAQWCLLYGMETLADTEHYRILWSQFAYIGTYATGAFLFRFAVRWLRPRFQGWWLQLTWLVPAIMVIAAFTNGVHGLVWPDVHPSSNPVVWFYARGPVFWFGVIYEYLLVAVSTILIVATAWTSRGIYRRQAMYVAVGVFVSVAGNLLYLMRILPLPLDITPMALTMSVGIIYAGVSRNRLVDLLPAARHRVVDLMPDGLFVVDTDYRIIDWNTAALSMWSRESSSPLGRPVSELVTPWKETIEPAIERSNRPVVRVNLPSGGEQGEVQAEVRPFTIRTGRIEGWIVLFRDETEFRRTEGELQQANERLEALNKELLTQAIHDSLTGLFNRAYLDEALPRELARCRRDGSSIGLLILDVDHFKEINDTFGHDVGDRILKDVARLVKGVVRAGDIPCRFGGDEFVAVMPGATQSEATVVAERIRETVSAKKLGDPGLRVSVTVSIGSAVFPHHADSAADLFRAADRALYAAKDAGRNRSITAPTAT